MRSFNEMTQMASKQLAHSLMGRDLPYETSFFVAHVFENARTPYARVAFVTATSSAMDGLRSLER
jgi:hypothetical protein